jgi:hypothetical protein
VTRLLLVCLDGCDDRVSRELLAAGRLPVLGSLAARGRQVRFVGAGGVFPDATWVPLLTGLPVGDVGYGAHFCEFDPETMGLRFRREAPPEVEPFWNRLPDRGAGVLALDPSELHPRADSRADHACCWHRVAPPHPPVFSSTELERELTRFGTPPPLTDPPVGRTRADEREASEAFVESAGLRGRAALAAAAGRDAAVVGFHEQHAAVHWLSHHWEDDHWRRPSDPEPELLLRVYEAVDAALAPLVDEFEDGNVAVVAARGGRPLTGGAHLLEELLARAGLLERARTARSVVPARVRERLARRVLNQETQRRLASAAFRDGYRWERTGVFPAPSWSTGLLRANVLGRESQGIVRPHRVDGVLAEAERLVRGLVDADTGEHLVRDVARTRDVFPGAKTAELPDLLVRWAGSGPATAARHPELGEWTAPRPAPQVWTEHRGSALAVVAGRDVPGADGEVDRDQLGLAPTLLTLAGADGSALPGAAWF